MADLMPAVPDAQHPVQIVRRAASLMRQRAELASPSGPWVAAENERIVQHGDGFDIGIAAPAYPGLRGTGWGATSQHIASWHPAVALVVAQWLDDVAHQWAENPTHGRRAWYDQNRAEALARTYLGECI